MTSTSTDRDAVVARDRVRFRLLLALWRASGGSELVRVDLAALSAAEGISRQDARLVWEWFQGEGLARSFGAGLNMAITHAGVVEIEAALRQPVRETEHFAVQIIQHFTGPVGAVQVGEAGRANVVQGVDSSGSREGAS